MNNIKTLPPLCCAASLLLSSVTACTNAPISSSNLQPPSQCEIRACGTSNDCAVGDYCEQGCCTPFQPGGCESSECVDIAVDCLGHEAGCECHILGDGGVFAPTGVQPALHFEENQSKPIQAEIALVGGDVLTTTGFQLQVVEGDAAAFSIEANNLTATQTAGKAIIEATFGQLASCRAIVRNNGATSSRNEVRLLAFDQETGHGIPNVSIHIELEQGATDDQTHPQIQTNPSGLATIELEENETAQVTLFHQEYDYVSVLNISMEDNSFVHIPLKRRQTNASMGGATGDLDFSPHLTSLDTTPGSIRLGMVSTSFPLSQLENFDTDLFLGGPVLGQNCPEEPSNPGCYDFSLPGVTSVHAAVWGGLIVSLPATPLKPNFDILGKPGRRYIWGIGGAWDIESTASIFHSIAQRQINNDCPTCDDPADPSILRSLLPLAGSASMGYRSNVQFEKAPIQDWLDHIGSQESTDPRFPHLDAGDLKTGLRLDSPMNRFTEVRVPPLPKDPRAPNSASFEGIIVMTGTQSLSAGFVPRGLGVGLDCLSEECIVDGVPVGYDGVVDGIQICPNDSNLACAGRTNYDVATGSVPLFHRGPTHELVNQPQKTILLAVPIDTLNSSDFRVRAIVIDGLLRDEAMDLGSQEFTQAPTILSSPQDRRYTIAPTQTTDVHHITLQSKSNPQAPKWHIYGKNIEQDFIAPDVPSLLEDPMANEEDLKITHATVKLRTGTRYSDLVANKEHAIHQLLHSASAFSSIAVPK